MSAPTPTVRNRRSAAMRTRGSSHRAFTLVELLVVVAILGILISIVWKGSSALLASSKTSHTKALFTQLDQALTQFESDKPFGRIPNYLDRYGNFPADEIGVLGRNSTQWPHNIHIVAQDTTTLVVPAGELSRAEVPPPDALPARRTVEAFILTVRQSSPSASVILDGIQDRFRVRDDSTKTFSTASGNTTTLEYYVDAWGSPLEYFSTRAWPSTATPTRREYLAVAMSHAGGERAVFASYGPNGPDQLEAGLDLTLQKDFDANSYDGRINDPLNDDNIYSIEGVRERIR